MTFTNLLGGSHDGTDWTIDENTVIAGVHTDILTFKVNEAITASVKEFDGSIYGAIEIHALNIIVEGTLTASGAGGIGGGGGGGSGGAGGAGPGQNAPSAPGGAPNGTSGGPGISQGGPGGAGLALPAGPSTPGSGGGGGGTGANGGVNGYGGAGGNGGNGTDASANIDTNINENVFMGAGGGGGGAGGGGGQGFAFGQGVGGPGGGGGAGGSRGGGIIKLIAREKIIINGRLTSLPCLGEHGTGGQSAGQYNGDAHFGNAGGPGGSGLVNTHVESPAGNGGGGGGDPFGGLSQNAGGLGGGGATGGAGAGGGILLKINGLGNSASFSSIRTGPDSFISVGTKGTLKQFLYRGGRSLPIFGGTQTAGGIVTQKSMNAITIL